MWLGRELAVGERYGAPRLFVTAAVATPTLGQTGEPGLPLEKEFGDAVRLTRQAKGLTLDELADRSSVSRAALSKIERGERNPSLKYALQIAEALRTPLSELLGQRHQPITVVRQGETIRLVDPTSRAVRESLLRPQPGAELIRYTLPPCTAIDPFPFHEAGTTETFVVLEGSCSVSARHPHRPRHR